MLAAVDAPPPPCRASTSMACRRSACLRFPMGLAAARRHAQNTSTTEPMAPRPAITRLQPQYILSKAIGVIPPLINTVYYTGRATRTSNTSRRCTAAPVARGLDRHKVAAAAYRFLYYDDDAMMKSMAELDPLLEAAGASGMRKAGSEH